MVVPRGKEADCGDIMYATHYNGRHMLVLQRGGLGLQYYPCLVLRLVVFGEVEMKVEEGVSLDAEDDDDISMGYNISLGDNGSRSGIPR